ncbi:hypothetical protein ACKI1I_46125 [Streptomyces turgidiscabies]|uniref:hypothetical protein n=1 Tax=Streptomyces TaxID=1883 RepID=UPI00076EC2DB|nr:MULTISPECIES: hypothetical protein [Streptomyces]MDX3494539.1 hypothetical protein [Streptomyces turgidiscabies]GAQ76427.1 hypothetical protein T45_08222 [Streptomyces turgidiscabies]
MPYDDEVQKITKALMSAVSAIGGLKELDLRGCPLLELSQVASLLDRSSSGATLAGAVRKAVSQAIDEIRAPTHEPAYPIRVGQGKETLAVTPNHVRNALRILLNEPHVFGNQVPEVRRKQVMEILGIDGGIKTFRSPKAGPELDLITILAKQLTDTHLHRSDVDGEIDHVAFESVDIEYVIVEDSEGPYKVRIGKAIVKCTATALSVDCGGFTDFPSYLLPWGGSYENWRPNIRRQWFEQPPLTDYPSVYRHRKITSANLPALYQPIQGCAPASRMDQTEPTLWVEFDPGLKAGQELKYEYVVSYPPHNLLRPVEEPLTDKETGLEAWYGGLELWARPRENISRFSIKVTCEVSSILGGALWLQEFPQRHPWNIGSGAIQPSDAGERVAHFNNPPRNYCIGAKVYFFYVPDPEDG